MNVTHEHMKLKNNNTNLYMHMHRQNFKCLKKSTFQYAHDKLLLKIPRINLIYIHKIYFNLSFLKQGRGKHVKSFNLTKINVKLPLMSILPDKILYTGKTKCHIKITNEI